MKLILDRQELRTRRLLAGLTQRQLADSTGVHPITIVKWETGARGIRPDKVARLADVLGCAVSDIAHVEGS